MFQRRSFLLLIAMFAYSFSQGQTVLYSEGFETNGEGVRYTSNSYLLASPTCDFFEREAASPLNVCFGGTTFNSFRGSFFWAGEDIMSSPGVRPPGQITTSAININHYGSLKVSLYLATANDNGTRWEFADSINIQASINGGAFFTVGRFMGSGVVGGPLINDLNLNGVYDAATESTPVSIPAFTKYTFSIPGSGTTMQIRLDFDQLGGSEESGIDDIEVTGINTLPVKLLYFNGSKLSNNSTALNWKIDEASDAASFDIQRSNNGRDFVIEKTVAATTLRTYGWIDDAVSAGPIYYRLKMIDTKGLVDYSEIVMINKNKPGVSLHNLSSNPVNDMLHVLIGSSVSMPAHIEIYDYRGATPFRTSAMIKRGDTNVDINTGRLAAGYYVVALTGTHGEVLGTTKFVKR